MKAKKYIKSEMFLTDSPSCFQSDLLKTQILNASRTGPLKRREFTGCQ